MTHRPIQSMRLPRKTSKQKQDPGPEDTQEMFTAGQELPGDPEETREYEAVALEVEESGEEPEEDSPDLDEEEIEAIEDEAWDGDEYEEWEDEVGDEVEEDDGEELDDGTGAGEPQVDSDSASRTDDLKQWSGEFGARAKALWSGLLGRIGSIKLPRHEIDGRKAMAVVGILLVGLLVGAGSYVLGKGSGDDLDQARLEGEFAGKKAGAIEGATKGYAAGFKKGRDIAFRKSYSASYRRNYIRAYENAGMEAPKPKSIEVPKP